MYDRFITTRLIAAVAVLLLLAAVGVACGDAAPAAPAEQPPAATQAASPTGAPPPAAPAPPVAATALPTAIPAPPAAPALPTIAPTPTQLPATPLPQPTPTVGVAPTAPAPAPTPFVFTPTTDESGNVAPDPDYQRAFEAARLSSRDWNTDFSLHTVPYSEIRFVIPRDRIPAIDAPDFIAPSEASEWLQDVEPVVSLEINGDARAYPLQILTWHEIVNDVVGDVPVSVTFCPLCNSAIAFDRRLDGETLDFGVSGNLRNSDLIMYDRSTHSWWQQFTGEGIVGEYAGRSLEHLSAFIVSFADFRSAHPDGKVLSRDTGFMRQYGRNPYAGYDTTEGSPFLFGGDLDGRLLPVERVIAVTIADMDIAFPLTILQEEGVINYTAGEMPIAVFHKSGTTSALDASSIADSRDVGSSAVFDANLDGQTLTFSVKDGRITDDQTGSVWNILGSAIEGALAGKSLTPVVHGNHFWFAWAVFKPDTIIYQGREGA